MNRLLNKLGIHSRNSFKDGYNDGYLVGLSEGKEFGSHVGFNSKLRAELPGILNRYSQLQIKIMNKPIKHIETELRKFTNDELEKYRLELQQR